MWYGLPSLSASLAMLFHGHEVAAVPEDIIDIIRSFKRRGKFKTGEGCEVERLGVARSYPEVGELILPPNCRPHRFRQWRIGRQALSFCH